MTQFAIQQKLYRSSAVTGANTNRNNIAQKNAHFNTIISKSKTQQQQREEQQKKGEQQ
jgi:hypothetical protein